MIETGDVTPLAWPPWRLDRDLAAPSFYCLPMDGKDLEAPRFSNLLMPDEVYVHVTLCSGSGTNYNMIIWGVLLVWFLFKIFVSK